MTTNATERLDRAAFLADRAVGMVCADPPAWLTALRADPAAARLGVTWLDDDAIAKSAREASERPSDWGLQTPTTMQRIRLDRPHLVPVAVSPYESRRVGLRGEAVWYVDARAPRRLMFAPDEAYPPFLHTPAGTTAAEMGGVLSGFFPDPVRKRVELPKVARGFMGYVENHAVPSPYTGALDEISGLSLDRYYTMNVYCHHGQSWGSAYTDDPFPEGPLNALQMSAIGREAMKQGDGVPSKTWRSAHSGSQVTIEIHDGEVMVAEVRYVPSGRPEVIADLNGAFGCDFPVDMPVDAVGMLIGFDFQDADRAVADLAGAEDLGQRLACLRVALAVTHGDLDGLDRLRPYLTHEETGYRVAVLNMLLPYNHEFLIEELMLDETEAEIVEQTQKFLNVGISRRHPDVFEGDGFDYDLYNRDPDEDDEEEDA